MDEYVSLPSFAETASMVRYTHWHCRAVKAGGGWNDPIDGSYINTRGAAFNSIASGVARTTGDLNQIMPKEPLVNSASTTFLTFSVLAIANFADPTVIGNGLGYSFSTPSYVMDQTSPFRTVYTRNRHHSSVR